MQKRGQLSVFVLLGAVIVIGVAFFLFTQQEPDVSEQLIEATSQQSVDAAFDSCVRETAEAAVVLQALQGGRLIPEKGVPVGGLIVSQAFNGVVSTLPTVEEMEFDLSINLPGLLASCLDEVDDLAVRNGVSVYEVDAVVNATLANDSVTVLVDYPVQFERGDVVTQAQPSALTFNRPVARMQSFAEELIFETELDSEMMPLGDLLDSPFEVNLMGAFNTAVVYSLYDGVSETTFMFAVPMPQAKFTFNAEGPLWTSLEPMVMAANQQFTGLVQAESGLLAVTYAVDVPWLEVDEATGEVAGVVDESYAGVHLVTFTATDSGGVSAVGVVEVTVQ